MTETTAPAAAPAPAAEAPATPASATRWQQRARAGLAAARSALWAAGAWVRAAGAWLQREPTVAAALVLVILLLGAVQLWPRVAPLPPQPSAAEQPAAVQTNPLAELVDRVYTLDLLVAELQDQVADLQNAPAQWRPAPSAPRRSAPAAAEPGQPQPQPQRPAAAWGQTDLDRAISNFTPPTTFGAHE